jgi:endonuclease-8
MPEGDTIFRTAATLRRALRGEILTGFRARVPGMDDVSLTGRRVTGVEARGKNLLIQLEGDLVLHTHMRMTGSWHVYRPGERWRKPERGARVVLETSRFVAICFNAPVVELKPAAAVERSPLLQLGPDLLDPAFDPADALRRLRRYGERTVGEAILIQRAVAGIGNVYKSEGLFLAGIHPVRKVEELTDEEIELLLRTARGLMVQNLDGFPRITRRGSPGGRYWVYGRSGRPCIRCGTRIRRERQGLAGRSTYWCPTCQPKEGGRRSG